SRAAAKSPWLGLSGPYETAVKVDTTIAYRIASKQPVIGERSPMSALTLSVNGQSHSLDVDPATPLLYVLGDDLGLRGQKYGCGLGQCGACTVIVKGQAVRSCITPVEAVAGSEITTLEGLGTTDKPHPIQKAFIDEQAMQCGFCINGVIMTAKA